MINRTISSVGDGEDEEDDSAIAKTSKASSFEHGNSDNQILSFKKLSEKKYQKRRALYFGEKYIRWNWHVFIFMRGYRLACATTIYSVGCDGYELYLGRSGNGAFWYFPLLLCSFLHDQPNTIRSVRLLRKPDLFTVWYVFSFFWHQTENFIKLLKVHTS